MYSIGFGQNALMLDVKIIIAAESNYVAIRFCIHAVYM
jgi:hypothetical protein